MVLIVGMIILGLVTFPNYFCLRLYNEDFQYIREVVDSYTNGKFFHPVWKEVQHCSLSVYLSAIPFYILFDNVGLLIYQWLMFGVSAWGLYLYARSILPIGAVWPLIHFFGMWGLYSALSGCIYLEVIGPLMLPYIFYAFHRRKWLLFGFTYSFLVLSKENYAIWSLFILVGMGLIYRRDLTSAHRKALLSAAGGNLLYNALLFLFIMPYLQSQVEEPMSRFELLYRHLWASDSPFNPTKYPQTWLEKIRNIILNWRYLWAFLWTENCTDFYNSPCFYTRGIKSELHLAVLLSGGWTFFTNIPFLLILLPIYGYKLLSAEVQMWGTIGHYSIEFAVTLPLSLIWFMKRVSPQRIWIIGLAGSILAHFTNFLLMHQRFSIWYVPEATQWYCPEHYCDLSAYREVKEMAARVPSGFPIYVQPRLMPYFNISKISIDVPKDSSQTFMFIVKTDPYSPSIDSVKTLLKSNEWQIYEEKTYVLILQKKGALVQMENQPQGRGSYNIKQ